MIKVFIITIVLLFISSILVVLLKGIGRVSGAVLMTIGGPVAMVSFYILQIENGNPDAGKEFVQLILPLK